MRMVYEMEVVTRLTQCVTLMKKICYILYGVCQIYFCRQQQAFS